MAHATENFESIKRTGGMAAKSASREYTIFEAATTTSALAALFAKAPSSFDGLIRDDDGISLDDINATTWLAKVPYKEAGGENEEPQQPPGNAETDWTHIEFDQGSGTQHVTQCLNQFAYDVGGVQNPARAMDIVNALVVGVTRDGVEGVDCNVATFSFGLTYKIQNFGPQQLQIIRSLAWKTNMFQFLGLPTGQVLFTGARGRIPNTGRNQEITLGFAVSEDSVNLNVGQGIVVPFKGAWEYLWIKFKKDPLANAFVEVPDLAFVSQLYQPADFAALNNMGFLPLQ